MRRLTGTGAAALVFLAASGAKSIASPAPAAGDLTGHVRSAAGPVTDAEVTLFRCDGTGGQRVLDRRRSGPEGTFTFHVEGVGRAGLLIRKAEYAPLVTSVDAGRGGEDVTFWISKGATLRGVVEHEGEPVAGTEVVLTAPVDRLTGGVMAGVGGDVACLETLTWREETDERGRFVTWGLPVWCPVEVALASGDAGAEPTVVGRFTFKKVEIYDAVMKLEGNVLEGRVLDESGAPVAGEELCLILDDGRSAEVITATDAPLETSEPDGWDRPFFSTGSDADGRFHFPSVPSGEWLVGFAPPEYSQATGFAALPARRVRVPLEVRATLVKESRWSLFGTVVDDEGKPVSSAAVSAGRAPGMLGTHTWTSSQGAFELSDLTGEKVFLQVYSSDHLKDEAAAFPRGSRPRIVLEKGLNLVCSARAGGPAFVWLTDVGSEFWMRTGLPAVGRLELRGLRPATYALAVVAPGSRRVGVAAAVLDRSGRAVDVELEPACLLTLYLSDEWGNAQVRVRDAATGAMLHADLLRCGQAVPVLVPRGRVECTLESEGRTSSTSLDLTHFEASQVLLP